MSKIHPRTPAARNRVEHLFRVVERGAAQRREVDLVLARALAEIATLDGFHVAGCASVDEVGERYGLAGAETRDLLDLGRGLPLVPGIEDHVRSGRIPVASAACLGRVWVGNLQREGDQWIEWALHETTGQLRHRLWRRLDEQRASTPVIPLTVFVKPEGLRDFQRARQIASRKAGKALTGGATLEVIADHYLASYDAMRRPMGSRRVPDTTYVAGRYIPIAVRREVYERQEQRCAVPLCRNVMFMDFAHIVWHASGGSREADNLVLLCSEHHFWFDAGAIRLVGTAAKPEFIDRQGRALTGRVGRNDEPEFLDAYLRRKPGAPDPTLEEALDVLDGFIPGMNLPLAYEAQVYAQAPPEPKGPAPP